MIGDNILRGPQQENKRVNKQTVLYPQIKLQLIAKK